MATILQGWSLAMQGQGRAGSLQIRQGLDAYQASGAEMDRPYFLALLAESEHLGGEVERGLAALDEALETLRRGRDFFYEPELYRLRGMLLSAASENHWPEAETCCQQALDVARRQHAKSLELRAAMSLCRRWQQQGKRNDARQLLEPIYGWFTEGVDTVDLQAARALIAELEA
jgi:predicted ATPase